MGPHLLISYSSGENVTLSSVTVYIELDTIQNTKKL